MLKKKSDDIKKTNLSYSDENTKEDSLGSDEYNNDMSNFFQYINTHAENCCLNIKNVYADMKNAIKKARKIMLCFRDNIRNDSIKNFPVKYNFEMGDKKQDKIIITLLMNKKINPADVISEQYSEGYRLTISIPNEDNAVKLILQVNKKYSELQSILTNKQTRPDESTSVTSYFNEMRSYERHFPYELDLHSLKINTHYDEGIIIIEGSYAQDIVSSPS